MQQTTDDYLTELFYLYDRQATVDWKVGIMYLRSDGDLGCPRFNFIGLDPDDTKLMQNLNQRELLHSEVCLEYDTTTKGVFALTEFNELIERLINDKVRFRAYCTDEGRAMRIETFWDVLPTFTRTDRESFRLYLIDKYGCDMQLASDKHLVSFNKHYKTGKQIKLYYDNHGMNRVGPCLNKWKDYCAWIKYSDSIRWKMEG